jgi:hypothetical protein
MFPGYWWCCRGEVGLWGQPVSGLLDPRPGDLPGKDNPDRMSPTPTADPAVTVQRRDPATRYDKLSVVYRRSVVMTVIVDWLRA